MRGGQWQALYLLEGLARAGHDVCLLAPPPSPLFAAASAKGVECRPAGALELARAAPSFDLVHAHDAGAHTLAAIAARRLLVVSRRVAFPVRRNPLSRWKYRRADCFIAVSDFVAGCLHRAGVPAERIAVVYDGVPPQPPAVPKAGRVIAPATADPRKGAALARRAAALGGWELHFSSDLPRDLAEAAVFLYLTEEEGLGSAVLLAMSAGVPVVASHVGGLPEAVAARETGLLVENTAEAVAAAVAGLLSNPAAAARLGTGGRRRAEQLFSLDAMVRGTLAVYHRVST